MILFPMLIRYFRPCIDVQIVKQWMIFSYLYMVLSDDSVSSSAAKNTFSVIVRVVDELTTFELQSPLINSVTSFVYRLIRDGNFTFARILR